MFSIIHNMQTYKPRRIYILLILSKLVFSSTFHEVILEDRTISKKNYCKIYSALTQRGSAVCLYFLVSFSINWGTVMNSAQGKVSRRDTCFFWAKADWEATHSRCCRNKVVEPLPAWVLGTLCGGVFHRPVPDMQLQQEINFLTFESLFVTPHNLASPNQYRGETIGTKHRALLEL